MALELLVRRRGWIFGWRRGGGWTGLCDGVDFGEVQGGLPRELLYSFQAVGED